MSKKLIYEIARPFCGFLQVDRHTFYNPPQPKKGPQTEYSKRILVEATEDEIVEAETAS